MELAISMLGDTAAAKYLHSGSFRRNTKRIVWHMLREVARARNHHRSLRNMLNSPRPRDLCFKPGIQKAKDSAGLSNLQGVHELAVWH